MHFDQNQIARTHQNQGPLIKLVKFGFRLLYHELAFTYDLVSWVVSLGQWRDWQKSAIPFLKGWQILEIAHGPGHMLAELDQRSFQVVGIDFSAAMGRIARKRILRRGATTSIIRGKAQNLPFATGSFSSVLVTFPSEFILELSTLEAIRRVLIPGGRLVVVIGAVLTSGGRAKSFIGWLYAITGQQVRSSVPAEQPGIWTLANDRLSSAGFSPRVEQVTLEGSVVTLLIGQRDD